MATATEVRVLNAKPLLLQPRPLSREPGSILLVRLLPECPKAVRLPWELWSHILRFVVFDGSESVDCDSFDLRDRRSYLKQRNSLLCVCKDMLEAALPLLYTHVRLFSTASLEKFVARLDESEQRWDSLRHNPFSTPGRWVQSLSIAHIPIPNVEALQATAINILLTRAFPLLPFLRTLCLHEGVPLSTASLHSLGSKVGLERLTTLRGVHWGPTDGRLSPALETLARCNQLERLEIINSPIISSPLPLGAEEPALHDPSPFHDRLTLNFPRLTYLSVVALSPTSIIAALLHAVLPELRHLMITPSDDSPDGVANTLLTIHGSNLQSLRINSPCCWPTLNLGMPPFAFVLQKAPRLRRLTLDYPLIPLAPPLESAHPLQVITIPRPNHRFLTSLEALLPQLPHLTVVRLKNVKWLKSGMYGKALESGVQGEMREWRRRLAKKKVRLVDASWRDPM